MQDHFSCQAVVFDMDGVLLDTEPLYTVAYNCVLEQYGVTLDPKTKLEIMGRRALLSVGHVIDKFGLPLTPQEFLDRRAPILDALFAHPAVIPGAEALVRSLHENEIPLAVATSSSRRIFELKTGDHGWFALFDQVVCGDDPELKNSKPAPDIFLLAAKRLGVSIEHCVIYEDSPSGVEAACAAGARTIALLREPADLALFQGAHRTIASFDEWSPLDS